ncbi:Fur family transcriptional regulator, ferric uptake regulator [Plantibacter flavus]|uniref:Fur family ferric uptake transcriptional regulator n=1 Tax=Plantibacter flavus TaxID=150123 RepID=A0A3N2C8V2_9MICO|nr:Fur family transcriptional regulator [Plantibacter flavus]ROR83744.1 Fur family ferric uptake transcriptional regulator [Plantibacter flavus]SMG26907.1 Fur family transcriptional regulator, ferric uptake regulator [Plantibacter flavus]
MNGSEVESTTDDFNTKIRAAGLRVTTGRLAVLDILARTPHADVEQVVASLKPRAPQTSPQAVYSVLNAFVAVGLVRRIEPDGHPGRYELRVDDNHHHLVCSSCGAVVDVDCTQGEAPCMLPDDTAGYVIDAAEITFWGVCPACQAAAA